MNLNMIAPINTLSYGYASLNFLKHLSRNCKISLFPIGQLEVTSEDYKELVQTSLNNQSIYDKDAPSLRIYHAFSLAEHVGRGKRVAMTFFELNKFTDREVHHLKSQDLVIVPSRWARDVCSGHGIKSEVVPLGVDTSIFSPANSYGPDELSVPRPEGPTVFLNIAKWELRKCHDALIVAFNKAFSKKDNVKLQMVPTNFFIGEKGNKEWCDYYKNSKLGDKIEIINRLSTQQEIVNIIRKSDVGLCVSRAEGWNLPMLEIMACGKRVITTNYSAHTEFVTKENALLIETPNREMAYDGVFFNGQVGEWAAFDENEIDQLVEYMRAAHITTQNVDPNYINIGGVETARKFTWDNAAKKLLEAIA